MKRYILKRLFIGGAAGLAASLAATFAIAGEEEDAWIAKVVAAYGGESLMNLQGLTVQEARTAAFPGQGYTSDFVEFADASRIFHLDFKNARGEVETWTSSNNGVFQSRNIFDGEAGYTIDYNAETYGTLPNLFAVIGGVSRTIDAVMARDLAQQAETANYLGSATYLGRPHEAIEFTQSGGPVITIFVDTETGLISKMARDLPTGKLYYHFQDHEAANGITLAKRLNLYIDNDPFAIIVSRNFFVNPRFSRRAFTPDRGLSEETAARIDTSELAYRKVADGVGHVGQGGAFSAFIEADEFLIGVGGYPGLEARLDMFRAETGNEKPLRYQVVTHHHTDHLGGMREAYDLGVTFVVHPAALENLKTAVGSDLPDDRLMIVEDRATLGGGAVEVYDITTSHAEHFLLTYASAAKATFMADHFGSPFVDDVPPAGLNGVTLNTAIKELGLDVDVLLSAHSPGARSWAEFEAAVAAYDPTPCKFNRAICQ